MHLKFIQNEKKKKKPTLSYLDLSLISLKPVTTPKWMNEDCVYRLVEFVVMPSSLLHLGLTRPSF